MNAIERIEEFRCERCGGQIDAAQNQANNITDCPICGKRTALIKPRKWGRIFLAVFGIAIFVVVSISLIAAIKSNQSLSEALGGVIIIVAGIAITWLAALWLVLPAIIYLSLREIRKDVAEIRRIAGREQ